jgi:hypothetical protein
LLGKKNEKLKIASCHKGYVKKKNNINTMQEKYYINIKEKQKKVRKEK